jgi:hypothetical protein
MVCQHRAGDAASGSRIGWLDQTSLRSQCNYLHPAQDDEVQPPQPALLPEDADGELFDDLPMPKRDISFSVFFEPHFSQHTSGCDPKTSFSKSALQSLQ